MQLCHRVLLIIALYVLLSTYLTMNRCRKAQRVTGCAAPRSGSALRQRWDTHPHSWGVGNLPADLLSGERQKAIGNLMCDSFQLCGAYAVAIERWATSLRIEHDDHRMRQIKSRTLGVHSLPGQPLSKPCTQLGPTRAKLSPGATLLLVLIHQRGSVAARTW